MMETVLRRLSFPEDESVFRQVWEWIQKRKRFYAALGGALDWEQYKARYQRPGQATFGLWVNDELETLVEVEQIDTGVFEIHAMSRPKAEAEFVKQAVYTVGWHLFAKFQAQRLLSMVPTFNPRARKLATDCGMNLRTPAFSSRTEIYGIDRAEFLRNHQNATRS